MSARSPMGPICKVWDAEYPWDVRVEKVCFALTAAGYRVHLVARNRNRLPTRAELPEATVHRLAAWSVAPPWLNAASMFPAFFNPRWLGQIYRVARDAEARLMLCRDLPLAIPSILAARRLGIPVVLDMAENYPAMLQARQASGQTGWTDWVVRNPALAQLVENWVLPRVDRIFVVVEESGDRLLAKGVPQNRIVLVSNTPPAARLEAPPVQWNGSGTLRLAYIGLLELQRGLATVVDAVGRLRHDGFPVHLALLGGGRDESVLKHQAAELGLGDAIAFHGWLPNHEALARLRDAHVGLIPHWRDESWNTTIPNKLFDYMAAGLAVITSDAGPAARIVGDTACGRIYEDRDADALARTVRAFADPDVWQRAAAAGRKAIRDRYHWEVDAERMVQTLAALTRPYSSLPAADTLQEQSGS